MLEYVHNSQVSSDTIKPLLRNINMITERYIHSFHDINKIRTMGSASDVRFDPWFPQQYIAYSSVPPLDFSAKFLAHSLHTSVVQENYMHIIITYQGNHINQNMNLSYN